MIDAKLTEEKGPGSSSTPRVSLFLFAFLFFSIEKPRFANPAAASSGNKQVVHCICAHTVPYSSRFVIITTTYSSRSLFFYFTETLNRALTTVIHLDCTVKSVSGCPTSNPRVSAT